MRFLAFLGVLCPVFAFAAEGDLPFPGVEPGYFSEQRASKLAMALGLGTAAELRMKNLEGPEYEIGETRESFADGSENPLFSAFIRVLVEGNAKNYKVLGEKPNRRLFIVREIGKHPFASTYEAIAESISPEELSELVQKSLEVSEALGLRQGAAHFELKSSRGQLYLIEQNSRIDVDNFFHASNFRDCVTGVQNAPPASDKNSTSPEQE